jgi:hypothetical protein
LKVTGLSTFVLIVRVRKVKLFLYIPRRAPDNSRKLRIPGFSKGRHVKVARLPDLGTGHRLPVDPKESSCYSFLLEAESTPGP